MNETQCTCYRVCLRIMNASHKHKKIEETIGVKATREHKKGDPQTWKGKAIQNKQGRAKLWGNDIWILDSLLPNTCKLDKHLTWLFDKILPYKKFLTKLRYEGVGMDIYCSYRTGSPTGGLGIHPRFYKTLAELNIPIEISVQFDEPLNEIFKQVSDHSQKKSIKMKKKSK